MALKIILEIVLLGLLVGGSYAGVRFGFISIVAKPIKTCLSIVFSFMLCSPVGRGIIAPIIQAPVTNYIKDFMYTNCEGLNPDGVIERIPTLLKISGAIFDVDVNALTTGTTDNILDTLVYNLTSPVVNVVGIIIAFVILFFVAKLLFTGGIFVVNKFFEGGILAKINQTMGFVLAGLLAIAAAWVLVSVLEFFFHLPLIVDSAAIQSFGDGGLLYRIFVSISPLELLLSF